MINNNNNNNNNINTQNNNNINNNNNNISNNNNIINNGNINNNNNNNINNNQILMNQNQTLQISSQQQQQIQNLRNLKNLTNFQLNPTNILFRQLGMCIDNLDIYNFQNLFKVNENNINLQTKNFLLNKCLLYYLNSSYQQMNIRCLKELIKILLDYKANPNLRIRYTNVNNTSILNNNNDNSVLFRIVEKNDLELLKEFLDHGAEINICDSHGRNSLFYLMLIPNSENNLIDRKPMCSLLLSRGIKVNISDNSGITPLMESINKGYNYILDLFIKVGSNVNIVNFNDGNTAMHYAVMKKNREAIMTLLAKGKADLSIRNKNGETVVDLAKKLNGNSVICDMIMNYANIGKDIEENNNNNENNNNSSSYNKNDNSDIFIFPKDDISSRIEIPFAFQNNNNNNFNDNESTSSNTTTSTNQFHSFIKIQNTPTLFIDISDETNRESLIYEGLKNEYDNLIITNEKKNNQINSLNNEIEKLKDELIKLKKEYFQQSKEIQFLNEKISSDENNHIQRYKEQQINLDENDRLIKIIIEKFENMKITNNNNNNENNDNNNNNENNNDNLNEMNNEDSYIFKKFNFSNMNNNKIYSDLTEDLIDFYKYNKMIYENRKNGINKIINYLKETIEIDVEIKLYGSYAYESSLIWSSVDLLIIPKKESFLNYNNNNNINNNNTNLNFNVFEKTNYYTNFLQNLIYLIRNSTFCKEITFIHDSNIITPILKVKTNEESNELIYYIYVLDSNNLDEKNNSLIQSVFMIKEYIKQYKDILIPITLAIKQLLFINCLIYDYYNSKSLEINGNVFGGISGYALILFIINFLNKECKENEKYLEKSLGEIFMDFLKENGLNAYETQSKKIINLNYNNNNNNLNNNNLNNNNNNIDDNNFDSFNNNNNNINNNNNNIYNFDEVINYYGENNGNNDSLIIIDPFNFRNNLTEKTYHYQDIKLSFMIAYCVAHEGCECSCHYKNNHIEHNSHCILNKIFKGVKRYKSNNKF